MPAFDFHAATGLTSFSRIMVRDPSRMLYMRGVPGYAASFPELIERLRSEIAALAPRTVTCVGTSAGGFPALLIGHMLEVEVVHAFSPPTYLTLTATLRQRDWRQIQRVPAFIALSTLPRQVRQLMDLRRPLAKWNGRTDFTIHVCRDHPRDPKRARYLEGLPHVHIVEHGCKGHKVAFHLARKGTLKHIFEPGGEPWRSEPEVEARGG
jgi:acetyl esterase/lipase